MKGLLLLLVSTQVWAAKPSDLYLEKFLKYFKHNTPAAMSLPPPKYDSHGRVTHSKLQVPVSAKDEVRKKFCNGAAPGESCQPPKMFPTAEISGDSDLMNFFENEKVQTNFEAISEAALLAKATAVKPWSGDYWPTQKGGIASRYRDWDYPMASDFQKNYEFYKKNWNLELENTKKLESLSPAEKYDLLMGLKNRPLTLAVLADAFDTYKVNENKIESWYGICHGWAPASFSFPRPKKTIEVPSLIGNLKIKFYPDDLKALASHLWANANFKDRIMGGRCDDKNPAKDEHGRIISEKCYDINPGSWHLAVINQLGIKGQSFVLDASYDQEVWNQPATAYKVKYFNPDTNESSSELSKVMIEKEKYQKDPFVSYRSPNGRFLVGVSMELTYTAEISAGLDETNDEAKDYYRTVQYIYDLELNERGEVIGGEWYQNAHPDFIWAPGDGEHAQSAGDALLSGKWQDGPPPQQWMSRAEYAAKRNQPLAAVVERLFELAK